jgi:hypothetical protein
VDNVDRDGSRIIDFCGDLGAGDTGSEEKLF